MADQILSLEPKVEFDPSPDCILKPLRRFSRGNFTSPSLSQYKDSLNCHRLLFLSASRVITMESVHVCLHEEAKSAKVKWLMSNSSVAENKHLPLL